LRKVPTLLERRHKFGNFRPTLVKPTVLLNLTFRS
jgi:hypothetical protein